jgi:vancomycin resistance protein YoaR
MQCVSVNGVDISGMTRDEALAATSGIEAQLFAQANFTVDVNGTQMNFTAQDFALKTDYQDVIEKAMAYGRTGTFDERLAAANAAKASPVDFPVTVSVDETGLKTALTALKTQLDTAPVDATATFAPWGYTAETAQDGKVTYTPFTPDLAAMKKMCTTYAKRKDYTDVPELVRLSDAEMPNTLRYEFFDDSKYNDDDIPEDWNIARFIYTDAVDGLVVNTDAIFDAVVSQVGSGSYETIVAPVTVTPATVKLADIKNQTQLISSWTSSFRNHDDSARVYNVSMMSCLISGSVIQPGGEWSANTTVGSRNEETPRYTAGRKPRALRTAGLRRSTAAAPARSAARHTTRRSVRALRS